MAEALFKKILKERGRERDIMVESCGIAAVEGMPASPNAVKVMKEEGIDISSHRARLLSEEILKADLILTMTKNHKDYILNKFPETKGRVFVLEEFASGQRGDENVDISDPYGGDEQTYRRVADEIKEKLKNVLARLEKS
jgi:protein-tyrosine-phosphatase